MFKLLVLCSAFIAMAATASLKINPEGLRVFWDAMSKQMKERQELIEKQIDSIGPVLHALIEIAKTQFDADVIEAAKPFWEGIGELEEKAQEKNATHCIDAANEQLYKYNASLYVTFNRAYADMNATADAAVDKAVEDALHADRGLAGLEERILNCSNLECANHLETEVMNMFNTVVIRIENALQLANNDGLISLLIGLEDQVLDQVQYENFSGIFLQNAKECVGTD